MFQNLFGNEYKDILIGVLTLVFCILISMGWPVIGIFSYVLIPAPVLFYRLKLGRQAGGIIAGAAFFLIVIANGGLSVHVFVALELLVAGFIIGELLSVRLSIEKTILYACAGTIGTGIAGVFFYSSVSHTSIHSLASEYITNNLNLALTLLERMEMPEKDRFELQGAFEILRVMLIRVLPALSVISSLFMVWANILIARPLLRLRGVPHTDFGPLNVWKTPDFFVWAAIGCGVVALIPMDPDSAVKIIALNSLLVLIVIYFFQGIAIMSHFFEKKGFSRAFKVFAFCMIALWQALFLVVAAIGFFDLWVNFRKLGVDGSENSAH